MMKCLVTITKHTNLLKRRQEDPVKFVFYQGIDHLKQERYADAEREIMSILNISCRSVVYGARSLQES